MPHPSLDKMQTAVNTFLKEVSADLDNLQATIDSQVGTINDLIDTRAQKNARIAELVADKDSLKTRLTDAQNKRDQFKTERDQFKASRDLHKSELDKRTTALNAAQAQNVTLTSTNTNLVAQLNSTESLLTTVQGSVKPLQDFVKAFAEGKLTLTDANAAVKALVDGGHVTL